MWVARRLGVLNMGVVGLLIGLPADGPLVGVFHVVLLVSPRRAQWRARGRVCDNWERRPFHTEMTAESSPGCNPSRRARAGRRANHARAPGHGPAAARTSRALPSATARSSQYGRQQLLTDCATGPTVRPSPGHQAPGPTKTARVLPKDAGLRGHDSGRLITALGCDFEGFGARCL